MEEGSAVNYINDGFKVIVADDESGTRSLLRDMVKAIGGQVVEVSSGKGAINEVLNSGADLVLTDLMMPNLDGFAVCRSLKGNAATFHVPIFLITGVADDIAVEVAFDAGADDVILKPFKVRELQLRIRNAVNRKRFIDSLLRAGT
ncbi:MAG: two-component system response regulator [Armatimonadota bacterium]